MGIVPSIEIITHMLAKGYEHLKQGVFYKPISLSMGNPGALKAYEKCDEEDGSESLIENEVIGFMLVRSVDLPDSIITSTYPGKLENYPISVEVYPLIHDSDYGIVPAPYFESYVGLAKDEVAANVKYGRDLRRAPGA